MILKRLNQVGISALLLLLCLSCEERRDESSSRASHPALEAGSHVSLESADGEVAMEIESEREVVGIYRNPGSVMALWRMGRDDINGSHDGVMKIISKKSWVKIYKWDYSRDSAMEFLGVAPLEIKLSEELFSHGEVRYFAFWEEEFKCQVVRSLDDAPGVINFW